MIRNILVPLDGSNFGEQALDCAMMIAKRSAARLHLAHVREPLIVADPLLQHALVDIESPDEARQYLDGLIGRLPDPDLADRAQAVVLEGAVGESLCDYSLRHDIDLVVMTTHGRGPWAKFWEGSIAETLVRTLPASIILIRATDQNPSVESSFSPQGFQHILMPVQTIPPHLDLDDTAWEIARLFRTRVTLLHVQNVAAANGRSDANEPTGTEATSERRRVESAESNDAWLEHYREEARSWEVMIELRFAEHVLPAEAILGEAQRMGCDLIAMETRCRSGLSRLVQGSTADWVVRHASAPVLLHCSRHPREKPSDAVGR